jgi:hypothetical protein
MPGRSGAVPLDLLAAPPAAGGVAVAVAAVWQPGRFDRLIALLGSDMAEALVKGGAMRVELHSWQRTPRGWAVERIELDAADWGDAQRSEEA